MRYWVRFIFDLCTYYRICPTSIACFMRSQSSDNAGYVDRGWETVLICSNKRGSQCPLDVRQTLKASLFAQSAKNLIEC